MVVGVGEEVTALDGEVRPVVPPARRHRLERGEFVAVPFEDGRLRRMRGLERRLHDALRQRQKLPGPDPEEAPLLCGEGRELLEDFKRAVLPLEDGGMRVVLIRPAARAQRGARKEQSLANAEHLGVLSSGNGELLPWLKAGAVPAEDQQWNIAVAAVHVGCFSGDFFSHLRYREA